MRGKKPIINAKLLEIVHHEVRAFTGRSPLRKSEPGKQGAIVDGLVSAGNAALLQVVKHFDPARRVTIETYASRCVRHAIWRTARPRKRDALSRELVRLDAAIQADDGLTTQHDIVPDEAGDALYDKISESAWRCLQQAMPEREFDVLLSCHAGYKRREIAKRLGVSTERVRQIRLRAVETVKRLYQTDATLRLAIDAPHFYQAQMADARHVLRAHRPPTSFWAHRDGLRQLEAEAGLYRAILPTGRPIRASRSTVRTYSRDPTDWTDAFSGRRKAGDA